MSVRKAKPSERKQLLLAIGLSVAGLLACNGKTPTEALVASPTPETRQSPTPRPTPTPTPSPTPVPEFRLRGTIYDWEGGTVRDHGGVTVLDGPQKGANARTDATGGYLLMGLQPGTIHVRAGATGFFTQTKEVTIVGDTTLDFTLDSP
ncbi:MAG TPA: carboxypeptidase-like regulatory domain-containing protein [Thermoanaerobaculia bacterium]|nr:carboxypeptidase-like regulatory domain-containing protein [Thermoanaerobaculia bacterium]